MPNYVNKICKICNNSFKIQYKKRNQKTCSKDCSYILRSRTRKTEHEKAVKVCKICKNTFEDSTKRKLSKKCKKCISKKMVETRRERGSYERTEGQNKKLSATLKNKYENGWNPNTEEHKKKLSKIMKEAWASGNFDKKSKKTQIEKYGVDHWMKTEEAKEIFSKIFTDRVFSDETRRKMAQSASKRVRIGKETLYTNGNGYFRKDLNCYFRSNWEANFARICNFEGRNWEYEPETFTLNSGKTYTPDFKVDDTYYEIKGRWIGDAKEKFDDFCTQYNTCKIELINGKIYKQLKAKYKKFINWEGK